MTHSDQKSLGSDPFEVFAGRLTDIIQRDPAGRGIARLEAALTVSTATGLATIGADFQNHPGAPVTLVTGFCIADAPRPAAETDGPPGTLFLAQVLAELGSPVTLVGDEFGRPLLEAGCDFLGLPRESIATLPWEPEAAARGDNSPACCQTTDRWIGDFLDRSRGANPGYLIAIERLGPSHTVESIRAQYPHDSEIIAEFERTVPSASRDVCHSMRGLAINAWTAKAHRLFEIARRRSPDCVSIGIGDGGNEIGSGAIPWSIAREAIAGENGGTIACRIATDHFLLAGVSDWGAFALAAALIHACGRRDLVAQFDRARQQSLLETIVRETDAVDGMTRQRTATVDGLTMNAYLQPMAEIRELLEHSL